MPYDTHQQRRRLAELLVDSFPDGLTTTEAANDLNVTTQTIRNHIDWLSREGGVPVYEIEGKRRFTVNPREYFRPLNLSLAQAWLLYLPLRRMVRANLDRHPLVSSLLERLALAFHSEIGERLHQADSDQQSSFDALFTELVDCWKMQTWAEIRYRPPDRTTMTTLKVAPWWFEPAVWSDSNYLIGGLETHEGWQPITLKLERIQSVRKLFSKFERPAADDILQRIEQTWGIWAGEGAPIAVTLRFHPRTYDRLRESRWHPTESIQVEADGFVRWSALISEPQEMMPWIRGWGADVEVLTPENLRSQIAAEAERTARLYGRSADKPQSFF